MKFKVIMLSLLIIFSTFVYFGDINSKVIAQTTLIDDAPETFSNPSAEQFEFTISSTDHAVIGIRPPVDSNYDIEIYTDTMYGTLIEGSYGSEGEIDFVALDKSVWASPPNRGAVVESITGTGIYQIEMENDFDEHTLIDTWSGALNASPGNPVLDLGLPGTWEDELVTSPSVLYEDGVYHMWYTGYNGAVIKTGYANSTNGIEWTKYAGNPVISGGPSVWDGMAVGTPSVIYNGTTYQMWYTGHDGSHVRIGYATSPDGLVWMKNESNPVLVIGPPGSWEDHNVHTPTVLFNGTAYQMWYTSSDGTNERIGYATSPDGANWTKYGANPVLDLTPPIAWDQFYVCRPTVIYDGMTYHMWYTGYGNTGYKIGYANSSDGVNWTKFGTNPVLDLGSSGRWDDARVHSPTVIYNGTTYHMWYAGEDGSNDRIGYATSLDGINWTKVSNKIEILDAYELTGAGIGNVYSIELIVPPTIDLDMFLFDFTGDDAQSKSEASWASENVGAGIDESIYFTAITTGDHLLVITKENGGAGVYSIKTSLIPLLLDDTPLTNHPSITTDYHFPILSDDHAVVGIKSAFADNLDLEILTDTTFTTQIESSSFVGDEVDFVVLNRSTWESPPNRGARVSSGTSSYVIEMENDVDDHLITETWSGTMDASFGGPVLDLGPPGSWDDSNILNPYVMFDGMTYHMWYSGNDGTNRRIGYAYSSDGLTWTRPNLGIVSYGGNSDNNIVLDIGLPGSWDDYHVNNPTIIFDGTTYHMWFTGFDGVTDVRIGYANSTDGINWTKYASNPVLVAEAPPAWDDNSVLAPEVVYDGAIYHMWFTGYNGTNTRIGYANSTNGVNWTKYPGNPVLDIIPSSWEDIRAEAPAVVYKGGKYHMWYTGYDGAIYRIGYANSTDGINWVRSGVNPILDIGTSGKWDDSHVKFPTVIYDGGKYQMWYQGHDGSNKRIGYATSPDGINWTKFNYDAEVLDAYEISGADIGTIYTIKLTVPQTADLDMFLFSFNGNDALSRVDAQLSSQNIGAGVDESIIFTETMIINYFLVITNRDGGYGPYTIEASPIPILVDNTPVTDGGILPNDWQFEVLNEDHAVVGVRPAVSGDFDIGVHTDTFTTLIESSGFIGDEVDFVVLNRSTWESPPNRGAKVSFRTSSYVIEMENDVDDHLITDTWSGTMDASFGGPVLDLGPPGSWEDDRVYCPTVVYDGSVYHMWYSGDDGSKVRIGYANSTDGIVWTKYLENPVLNLGPSAWDSFNIGHPSVLYDGIKFHMWYHGTNGANTRIGYANSTDGITWTKHPSNPIVNIGSPTDWDDVWVGQPTVIHDGTLYHMWFIGHDGSNYRIGYANSTDEVSWNKNPTNPVLDLGSSNTWEDLHVLSPEVIYDGAMYHMWYQGRNSSTNRIGYAKSTNGINWTKSGSNPVLDLGSTGSWDDMHVSSSTVYYDGAMYHMWYSGHDGSNYRIGYATSPDGINWTKFHYNAEVLDAYEINGLTAGSFYTVDLEVPLTADLDMFILNTTGGRIDAVAASNNSGAGINESFGFIAPASGDYLLVITNEDGGIGPYIINPPSNLTITGTPKASGNVLVGETNVVVEQLTLSVDAHSVGVTAIKIDQIGTADDIDLGNLYLYDDVNDNSILEVGIDRLLDTQIFSYDTLIFSNLSIMVNTSTDENLLVAMDIPLDAEVGNTIQLSFPDNTYFTVNEPDNVSALNFPILSNILTIVEPTLTVTGTPKATGSVLVGQENVVMEQLTLTSEFDSVNVTGITVYLIGIGEDTDIANVCLYDDIDDDGELDPTDILLDTKIFTDGNLTFGPLSYPINLGIPENLLIVFDISNSSTIGHVIGLIINTSSEVSVLSPAVVSPTNFPIISGFIEITGVEITGSVEDLNDNPIENAVVQLLKQTDDIVDTFTTNSTGSFFFEDLFYDNYTLNVTADGYEYNNSVTVDISLETPVLDVGIIKLEQIPSPPITTGNITGKVVDEDDSPIESAIVQLKNSTGSILATYTTNSTGDFEFTDVLFETYNLTAFAEGYEENDTVYASISSGAPDVDVGNIKLSVVPEPPVTTGNITGKVVDESIIPIEDAIVQIRNSTGALIATYTTNLTGDFEFMNIPFDTYSLTVFADGYETNDTVAGAISSGIPNVNIGNIILTKIPAPPIITGNITGKIVDEDGIPIEGAIVQLKNSTGSVAATYTTNSTGDFEFIDVQFGTYNLVAFAEGYQTNDTASATITSGNPDEDVGDIVLTTIPESPITTGNITGKVVDGEGSPIESTIVQIKNSSGVIIATHTTDSTGDFEFMDIPFDTYDLSAFAEGYEANDTASATITSDNPDEDIGEIVLTAIPEHPITTGNITGKVVDEDGDPIEGAIVQLKNDSGSIVSTFTTDPTGDFEFTDVPFATYNLVASAKGYETNDTVSGTITFETPDIDVGDIQLSIEMGPFVPTTGTINGNVYDSEGSPIQNVIIELLDEAGNPAGTQKTTDVNGYYNFVNIGFGNYSVEVSHEDYITANSDIFKLDTDNPDIYIITTLSPIPEETPPPEEKETTPLWLWLLIFHLIVICVILFFLWLYSRKREPEEQVGKPRMPSPKEPVEAPQEPSPEEPVEEQSEKQTPKEPPEIKPDSPQKIPPPPPSESQPSESQETPPPSTEEQATEPKEIPPPDE